MGKSTQQLNCPRRSGRPRICSRRAAWLSARWYSALLTGLFSAAPALAATRVGIASSGGDFGDHPGGGDETLGTPHRDAVRRGRVVIQRAVDLDHNTFVVRNRQRPQRVSPGPARTNSEPSIRPVRGSDGSATNQDRCGLPPTLNVGTMVTC
jgi:hypothetical protein